MTIDFHQIPTLSEVSIKDKAFAQKCELTISDIHYLTIHLKDFLDSKKRKRHYEQWYIQSLLSHLKEYVPTDALAYNQLCLLEHQIKGDTYCESCDAYFPSWRRFCPNCGGVVDSDEKKVLKRDVQEHYTPPVPFPNSYFLRQGTFEQSRCISSAQINKLQKMLSDISTIR